MRICYTSDLHGRLAHYERLTDILRGEEPELLILGGDMHSDSGPDDPLTTQVAFLEHEFLPRVDEWKASVPGLEVVCILGNHDLLCTQVAMQDQHEAGRLVLLDHKQVWEKDSLRLLGLPLAPPSPYWVKDYERLDLPGDRIPEIGGAVWDQAGQCLREVSPEEHFGRLPTLADELGNMPPVVEPWIFVCHAPPYGTKLDRLPEIDHPIGSRAVRAFIEQRQPFCALHGHVHESPDVTGCYHDYLGQTLCINPGQDHDRLHAVMFDTQRLIETLRHTVYG